MSKKKPECVLCQMVHQPPENDTANLLLYRGKHCFVVMNLYPYNSAHLMVVPYIHLNDLTVLESEVVVEMGDLTQRSLRLLKEVYRPEGFNLGMNLGKVAGAGIDDHLHQHIVPRWGGDTNFMPVLGETRCLPETLPDTYAKLKANMAGFFETTPKS